LVVLLLTAVTMVCSFRVLAGVDMLTLARQKRFLQSEKVGFRGV